MNITLFNDVYPVTVDVSLEEQTVQILLERELGSGVQVLPDGRIVVNGEQVLLVSEGTTAQADAATILRDGDSIVVNTKHDNG